MSEENKNPEAESGRRRLLKALGIAGVGAAMLPTRWFQPIVDTIISPTNAQGAKDCSATGLNCVGNGGYVGLPNTNAVNSLLKK